MLAAAAAPIPLLLPRAGLLWSVPALAPLLGTIALAPAFVGVAALAPTPARRAGLAAAGLWWLLLAEALTGKALLFGSPDGTVTRGDWDGSISARGRDALRAARHAPALAPVLAWAAVPWCSAAGAWPLARARPGRRRSVRAALVAAHRVGDRTRRRRRRWDARARVAGSIAAASGGSPCGIRTAAQEPLRTPPRSQRLRITLRGEMSMLRNLEAKLEGLVEGAFSRAFKSSVQPVELARKLAKEMEDNQMVSVSRAYVPNHYVVFLSPDGSGPVRELRGRLKELSDYLLEHARPEGFALSPGPRVEFGTDERLGLGEFGIQALLLTPARGGRRRLAGDPDPLGGGLRAHDGLLGRPRGAQARAPAPTGAAMLVGDGRRTVLHRQPRGDRPQPECGHRARRPERLAAPRRAAPRG